MRNALRKQLRGAVPSSTQGGGERGAAGWGTGSGWVGNVPERWVGNASPTANSLGRKASPAANLFGKNGRKLCRGTKDQYRIKSCTPFSKNAKILRERQNFSKNVFYENGAQELRIGI